MLASYRISGYIPVREETVCGEINDLLHENVKKKFYRDIILQERLEIKLNVLLLRIFKD